MAVVKRKKKDPALKLSKYPQYIIDLNKPDNYLKFYKEARWAGFSDSYIESALISEFKSAFKNPDGSIKRFMDICKEGDEYIKNYEQLMWHDFLKNNPQFKNKVSLNL
jgi:hypothetical protein